MSFPVQTKYLPVIGWWVKVSKYLSTVFTLTFVSFSKQIPIIIWFDKLQSICYKECNLALADGQSFHYQWVVPVYSNTG